MTGLTASTPMPLAPGERVRAWWARVARPRRGRFRAINGHGRRPVGHTVHCPVRTSLWFECRRQLPCTSHALDTPAQAQDACGHVLVLPVPPRAARRRSAPGRTVRP